MKSTDSRNQLIEKVKSFIMGISPAKTKELEEEIMHDNKITTGDFLKMLSGRYSLEDASDAELYWILNAASKVSKTVGKREY